MKIGLMGCEFVSPNKGCEALAYSIIYILNKCNNTDDNLEIYNFSGTELGEIQTEFKNIKFKNIMPKLKDCEFNYLKNLNQCDFILDATMGDSFSDIYSNKYYDKLILHKRIAEAMCKNYILLPQTYGPFYYKGSDKKAKGVFKRAKYIYCRDEMSQKILETKFNIKNSELVTDMAFLLPYNKNRFSFDTNKIKLGINVSGLLYKGGFESSNQFNLKIDYKKYINELIEKYSNNEKYEIYLIPHVIDINENAHDDDYKTCKKIAEKYKNCILAPLFKNPIDAKSYISNMDIFIGARMHSTIASFSSGVVTIPVSYSRKFEGLFNSLNYKYIIHAKEYNTDEAVNKTIEYCENTKELSKSQEEANEIINKKINNFIYSIGKIIKEDY